MLKKADSNYMKVGFKLLMSFLAIYRSKCASLSISLIGTIWNRAMRGAAVSAKSNSAAKQIDGAINRLSLMLNVGSLTGTEAVLLV